MDGKGAEAVIGTGTWCVEPTIIPTPDPCIFPATLLLEAALKTWPGPPAVTGVSGEPAVLVRAIDAVATDPKLVISPDEEEK